MKFETCPDCGAHLDFGEACGCMNFSEKERRAPDRDSERSPKKETYHAPSIAQIDLKSKSEMLIFLRELKKITPAGMVEVVKRGFPRFTRSLLSNCEHENEYGVELKNDALDALISEIAPELLEAVRRRRQGGHKLTRRIACRLKDEEYDALLNFIREDGFDTMNDWLVKTVRRYLKRKSAKAAKGVKR